MSTQETEQPKVAYLPDVAAEYKRAANNDRTRQISKAMTKLQRTASRAVFPRKLSPNELASGSVVLSHITAAPSTVESAVLTSGRQSAPSERQASRLYTGARAFI